MEPDPSAADVERRSARNSVDSRVPSRPVEDAGSGSASGDRRGSQLEDASDSGAQLNEEPDQPFYSTYPEEPLDTEFKKMYPPDRFGEEASENARVWKIYRDHAAMTDRPMLDGWNKTLDILLIFAGLFSAVSTAFIVESYKLLQLDNSDYIAHALFVALTNSTGSSLLGSAGQLSPPGSSFKAFASSRWINGLWFCSLVLSLAVALLCILAKQWIEEYNSRVSAPSQTQRHWARRHRLYNGGLLRWRLPALISLMPVILHVSLFLFLAGLVIFLHQLDSALAMFILCLAVLLGLFYTVSTIIPVVYDDCPSATAVTRQILLLRKPLLGGYYLLRCLCIPGSPFSWNHYRTHLLLHMRPRPRDYDGGYNHYHGSLDVSSLLWLARTSPSPDATAAAVQAFGAFPLWSAAARDFRRTHRKQDILDFLPSTSDMLSSVADIARYARTVLFVACNTLPPYNPVPPTWFTPDQATWLHGKHLGPTTPPVYDLPLLCYSLRHTRLTLFSFDILDRGGTELIRKFREGRSHDGHPPFLTSTSILILTYMQSPSIPFLIYLYNVQRLELLEPPGFRFVVGRICDVMKQSGIPCNAALFCSRCLCLEALCQIYCFSDRLQLDTGDIDSLIQNIERTLLKNECSESLRSVSSERSGSQLDYFLRYLASEHCLTRDSTSFVKIRRIVTGLYNHVRTEPILIQNAASQEIGLRWFPSFPPAILKVLDAVPWALEAPTDGVPTDKIELASLLGELCYTVGQQTCGLPALALRRLYGITAESAKQHHPCIQWYTEASEVPSLVESPVTLLEPFNDSAWRKLNDLLHQHRATLGFDMAVGPRLEVAGVLAALLCAMHREGKDVSEFFAELLFARHVQLMLLHESMHDRKSTEHFVCLARHCREICATWWPELVRYVMDEREALLGEYGGDALVGHIQKMDRTLRYAEAQSCTECPGPIPA